MRVGERGLKDGGRWKFDEVEERKDGDWRERWGWRRGVGGS